MQSLYNVHSYGWKQEVLLNNEADKTLLYSSINKL